MGGGESCTENRYGGRKKEEVTNIANYPWLVVEFAIRTQSIAHATRANNKVTAEWIR